MRRTTLQPPSGSPPSSYAAYGVVQGEAGAIGRFAALTLLRSFVIAPGLIVAKVPEDKVWPASFAASVGVSALTLLLASMTQSKDRGRDRFAGWRRVSRWPR